MKAQASMEFILLFVIILFAFVVVLSFVTQVVGRQSVIEQKADVILQDLKTKSIGVSIAVAEVETTMVIPRVIDGTPVQLELHADPDNLAYIVDDENRKIARTFLPIIHSSTGSGNTITIKKVGEDIIIEQT